MLRQLFLPISLTSALWRLSMADPVDPTITPAALLPRQDDNDFVGWFSRTAMSISPWTELHCETSAVWRQNGNYAQCCAKTDRCLIAISCTESLSQAYVIWTDPVSSTKVTVACTDNASDPAMSICNTVYVSESYGQNDPDPKTIVDCGYGNQDWRYYRHIPPSLTEQGSTSSTSSLPGTSISSLPGTTTSSSSGISSTTAIAPKQTPEPESGSKAWIAGAVAGPILGLALIGAGVWLFLRRKKKAAHMPQYGVTTMDSSQPPAGVGGYTDAKPQYQPAQHGYPSPAQSQAYPQQGGFSPPHMSPAPQYGFIAPSNATPSPSMGAYAHDAKYEVNREAEAAELGGSSTIVREAAPPAQGRR